MTERPKEPPWNGGAGLILCRGFKSLRLRQLIDVRTLAESDRGGGPFVERHATWVAVYTGVVCSRGARTLGGLVCRAVKLDSATQQIKDCVQPLVGAITGAMSLGSRAWALTISTSICSWRFLRSGNTPLYWLSNMSSNLPVVFQLRIVKVA